jgi:hypothetical protein
MEVLEQVRDRPAPPPRTLRKDIPPPLEAICLRCLEKNPAQRYATAAALADDLALYLANERPRAYKGYRPPRWLIRVVLGAITALSVVGLVVAMGWHRPLGRLFVAAKKDPPVIEKVWMRADTDEQKKQAVHAMGVLYRYCFECHGAVSKAGNHDVRDIRALTGEATKRGRFYVVPGELKKSYLWTMIEDGSMPPDEELPAADKETIRKWIESGAPGWYETGKQE